jgi:YHS domain-containing protein
MRRLKVLENILAGAVVSAVLIVNGAIGQTAKTVPAKSDSGKVVATEKITAPAKHPKPQTTCPVMGEAINKSLYVDYNGKRIYVCCKLCIDSVKKDPEMYIKKLEKLGQSVETIAVKETEGVADYAKLASKDTSAASKKCTMMNDTSKKKYAMMNDTSKKKCPMMGDTSKVKGCYTCPMHPEVMQKGPGKCPKCGMDLVFQTCKMDAKGKGGCCKMKKQD